MFKHVAALVSVHPAMTSYSASEWILTVTPSEMFFFNSNFMFFVHKIQCVKVLLIFNNRSLFVSIRYRITIVSAMPLRSDINGKEANKK